MKRAAPVLLLALAAPVHADPALTAPVVEADGGITHMFRRYAPELSVTAGLRFDWLVVGARATACYVPDRITHTGNDVTDEELPVTDLLLGPAVRFDVPSTPFFAAASLAYSRITSGSFIWTGYAAEARVGASVWRHRAHSIVVSLQERLHRDGGEVWETSASVGYEFN